MTPLYSKLLEFLNLQAWHFESVSSEQKPQTTTHRSYSTTVQEAGVVCGRGNHPLDSCGKFQGLAWEERWDMVKEFSYVKTVQSLDTLQVSCTSDEHEMLQVSLYIVAHEGWS